MRSLEEFVDEIMYMGGRVSVDSQSNAGISGILVDGSLSTTRWGKMGYRRVANFLLAPGQSRITLHS